MGRWVWVLLRCTFPVVKQQPYFICLSFKTGSGALFGRSQWIRIRRYEECQETVYRVQMGLGVDKYLLCTYLFIYYVVQFLSEWPPVERTHKQSGGYHMHRRRNKQDCQLQRNTTSYHKIGRVWETRCSFKNIVE
jgi:hypothetical protein